MNKMNRRDFIQRVTAAGVSLSLPLMMSGRLNATPGMTISSLMPTRQIPSTGESLGVIGYSSAGFFRNTPVKERAIHRALLQIFIDSGGNYIDTDAGSEKNLAGLLDEIGSRDQVFVGRGVGSGYRLRGSAGDALKHSQATLGKKTLDLAQVRYLADMENRWPELKERKEAGKVRHIGVTTAHHSEYEKLEAIMKRYRPDFIQVNYSVLEPEAGERILPLAKDLGIAVVVNRPLVALSAMRYTDTNKMVLDHSFGSLSDHPLPECAAEFDCTSWRQFSLKFILANPSVTCVMVESRNVDQARDSVQGALGQLPDASHVKQMREYVKELLA